MRACACACVRPLTHSIRHAHTHRRTPIALAYAHTTVWMAMGYRGIDPEERSGLSTLCCAILIVQMEVCVGRILHHALHLTPACTLDASHTIFLHTAPQHFGYIHAGGYTVLRASRFPVTHLKTESSAGPPIKWCSLHMCAFCARMAVGSVGGMGVPS